MTEQIRKLLQELDELTALDDPAFTARTQSQRVCRQAAETIRSLLQEVQRLTDRLKALGGC
jgi:hypothetical protein